MQNHNIEEFSNSANSTEPISTTENLYEPDSFRSRFPRVEDNSLSVSNGSILQFDSAFVAQSAGTKSEAELDNAATRVAPRESSMDSFAKVADDRQAALQVDFKEGLKKTSFPNQSVHFEQFSRVAQKLGFSREIAQSTFKKLNPDANAFASADKAAETLSVMTLEELSGLVGRRSSMVAQRMSW